MIELWMNVFIGVGSNLGDRNANIKKAIDCLRDNPAIIVKKISSIIETDPVGGISQPKFLNGVIKIETSLLPRELLFILQDIERGLGRVRAEKNGPRIIDLDILLFGDKIIDEADLKIPHPLMFERDFVMKPLLEIEPDILGRVKTQ